MAGHDETLTTRDRFRGALLGLAVGEAIGAPAEFLTAEQVAEKYGVITEMIGGGVYEVSPGETVDATDMMLCLAESLADVGSFDPENVIERYRLWFESHPRHVSLTVRATLAQLPCRDALGPGLAPRLRDPRRPHGRQRQPHPLRAARAAQLRRRRDAACTLPPRIHTDPLRPPRGLVVRSLHDLLTAAIHGDLREQVPAIAATLDEEDKRVSTMLTDTLVAEPEELRSSSFVLDTLQTALWTVLHATTFEHAVCAAVNRAATPAPSAP